MKRHLTTLKLLPVFAVAAIVAGARAEADIIKLVCPEATYSMTIDIDLEKGTVRTTTNLEGGGHPSPVRAEITDNFIRFPTPNGQSRDVIDRATLELTHGSNGKKIQCRRGDKGI